MFGRKSRDKAGATTNAGTKNRIITVATAVLIIGGLFYVALTAPGVNLLQFRFNPFALISATTLIVNLGLFIYFVRKAARTEERIWLAVYILGIVVYAAGELLWRLSGTPQGAEFWTNISDAGAIIPAALYLFTLSYTNQSERRYPGTTAILLLASALLVLFLSATKLIYINDPNFYVPFSWGFDVSPKAAIPNGFYLDVIWWQIIPIFALARLISFRRHTRNAILRRQSLIFIFATGIPSIGGAITDGVLPALGLKIPTLAIALATPGAILFVYGVLRYQLLTVSPTIFSGTILGIMQESVVVTDDKYNLVYLNPKAEAMLGIRADASNRVSLLSVMQKSSSEAFERSFTPDAVQKSGEVDIAQIDLKPVHASPLPVRVNGTRLALSDLKMWVIAMSDITKELQTRSVIEHEVQVRTKELQEARAYLLSSINSLEQGFVLLNAKLGVEVINHAAQEVFKLKQAQTGTLQLASFVNNADWDADLSKAIERVLSTKRYYKIDAATKDGSFYQIFLSPILLEDHILGVAVIIQNVTEQRILDRSRDEFFSIASHELRTPLTAIRGNMSMVRDYFPDALKDEGLAAMVTDTHDASVRLIAIVNDFLDSSRLEQGKMQFDIKPISLAPIVDSVQKDLTTLLDKQKNKLTVTGIAKLPKVLADEARIRQIIYNLLSNAIKYSGEGAAITVAGESKGEKLLLRVTDTGKGISPENQKLLFHKFQQAGDPLTRDDTKGTGLGLYISKLLATNMHGDVELEKSEEGKGSTFMLTLPLAVREK